MVDIDLVLERELTDEQRDAVRDSAQEVLTLAGAGSGKSRTIAFRIAWLVAKGADPRSIVAFTFTEKAAESMKLQVSKALAKVELAPTVLGAMYIGTIHSFCHTVLAEMDAKYRQYEVLDENRLKLYLISRYPQLRISQLRNQRRARYFEAVFEVSEAWKILNDEMVDLEDLESQDRDLGSTLRNLRGSLERDQFIDFSLMVRHVVEALRNKEPGALRAVGYRRHLLVDEYQDVNPSQEALVEELRPFISTLFVVGDDDQAIYSWRGADVTRILTFGQRYPNCSRHTLSRNFRSTTAVVEAANAFAAAELGATRISKQPTATNPPGSRDFRVLWFRDRVAEAEWVADTIQLLRGTAYTENNGKVRGLTPGDFAILMRSTRRKEQDDTPCHDAFTQALEQRGIHYTLQAGGGIFDRDEVAALREGFELLRDGSPSRERTRGYFNAHVLPVFPAGDFEQLARVMGRWGRLIHGPTDGPRRRVHPQGLVHDLLNAFGVGSSSIDPEVMHDLGVFSRIIQDVEAIYVSIDSADRFREILNFLTNVAETGYDTSTEQILRRPDAVAVSTVHKAKGLEFPVVFVVDVEANRFPHDEKGYSGWLPDAVVNPALQRGAYRSTRDSESRLFYTAITRAERYLYVTGCEQLPGGKRHRKQSPYALRLVDHPEVCRDPNRTPAGLYQQEESPRADETVVPTTYSDVRYYLQCPHNYQLRKSFGFSPPIPDMFGFGKTVHTAVTKLHEVFASQTPTGEEADALARNVFHLKHVPKSTDPARPGPYETARDKAGQIVRTYAETFSEDFAHKRQVEVGFEVPVQNAVISGSIDLLLETDRQGQIVGATVIDFKAIEGGESPAENERLHWTELALQVQLYAKAARDVLEENAKTGAVHLLKDNQRVEVPVDDEAIEAAVGNVEWVVERILEGSFPMRPQQEKCGTCDFRLLCPKTPQDFATGGLPPPIRVPGKGSQQLPRAFSEFETKSVVLAPSF